MITKFTKLLWCGFVIVIISGCESVEPRITKVEDRIKPPYNYIFLKELNGDTRFDYKWSNYDDGYLRVGDKFIQAYEKVEKQVETKEKEELVKAYSVQKEEIVKRFKQNGEIIASTREKRIIDAFTRAILDENESIIETGDEFSVINDITIAVPQVKE